MLTSLGFVLLLGLVLGTLATKLRLPSLVGMLLAGILLGPCVLNLLSPSLLGISADLRQLALVIILTRAGLSLDVEDLRRAGRPAILMCFLPAAFEVLGMVVLAPRLLGVSTLDAAIMGAVVGAVSPAVIVPRMLKLMEEGYGTAKGIPQMCWRGPRWTTCSLSSSLPPSPAWPRAAPSPPPLWLGCRYPLCWGRPSACSSALCWPSSLPGSICGTR